MDAAVSARVFRDPSGIYAAQRAQLDAIVRRFAAAGNNRILTEKEKLASLSGQLQALSPLKVISRGYAMLTDADGQVVSSVSGICGGDELTAKLFDGTINLKVMSVDKD